MKLEYLKWLLVTNLSKGSLKSLDVSQELVEQVFAGKDSEELTPIEVTAYQVNGTTVFLSNDCIREPNNVIFVDLKTGRSFLKQLEN